jgi:hypothetical protein
MLSYLLKLVYATKVMTYVLIANLKKGRGTGDWDKGVMQLCSYAVKKSCSHSVLQLKSSAVLGFCSSAVVEKDLERIDVPEFKVL